MYLSLSQLVIELARRQMAGMATCKDSRTEATMLGNSNGCGCGASNIQGPRISLPPSRPHYNLSRPHYNLSRPHCNLSRPHRNLTRPHCIQCNSFSDELNFPSY